MISGRTALRHLVCAGSSLTLALVVTAAEAQSPACGMLTDGTFYSAAFSGSTVGLPNNSGGSCGGNSAPEASFAYVAPRTGTYIIDTMGSSFDTLLYVRSSQAGGAELACNDDAIRGATYSQVTVKLTKDVSYQIVVDGFGTASGTFTLRINPACPATNAGDP